MESREALYFLENQPELVLSFSGVEALADKPISQQPPIEHDVLDIDSSEKKSSGVHTKLIPCSRLRGPLLYHGAILLLFTLIFILAMLQAERAAFIAQLREHQHQYPPTETDYLFCGRKMPTDSNDAEAFPDAFYALKEAALHGEVALVKTIYPLCCVLYPL